MNPLGANWLVLAQAATSAAEKANEAAEKTSGSGGGWQGAITLLVVVAVLVLPFVIGNLIAAALRMKEVGTRLGVTLLALTLCSLPFFLKPLNEAISLGIDLAGGTNLVYEVEHQEGSLVTPDVMTKMVE